jgi:hypothetical protein
VEVFLRYFKGALDLLEELRHERDELDTLIRGLEKRLGIVPENVQVESMPTPARVSQSVNSIPLGFFHNMTQADAADKLLCV